MAEAVTRGGREPRGLREPLGGRVHRGRVARESSVDPDLAPLLPVLDRVIGPLKC